MRTYFILALILLSQTLAGQSREEEELLPLEIEGAQTQLLLKLGAGIPLSDFADDNFESEDSGFAIPGLLFETAIDHFVTPSIYLSAMGRFQYNSLNEDEFTSFYRSVVGNSVSINFESDNWRINSYLFGLGTRTEIDMETQFLTRFMIGYSTAQSPTFNATLSDGVNTVTEAQTSASGNSLGFLVGLGLKIEASDRLQVLIAADYFSAAPNFSDVQFTATDNGSIVYSESFSFEQQIELLNLSVGLAFPL